jgi:hypothetical protein
LKRIVTNLKSKEETRVIFTGTKASHKFLMAKSGLDQTLGRNNQFATVSEAVADIRKRKRNIETVLNVEI